MLQLFILGIEFQPLFAKRVDLLVAYQLLFFEKTRINEKYLLTILHANSSPVTLFLAFLTSPKEPLTIKFMFNFIVTVQESFRKETFP